MDYKEKYEQSLERAKVINPGTADYEVAVKIFPELKESEDEKIRKYLIDGIKHLSEKSSFFTAEVSKGKVIAWLEKQGEQKPKDEPKFKVGDWITNGACTIQITSVDDTYYWHDNDCVGGDIESMDKEYHFWTIQDAKDGDVLANDNSIIIFRSIGNYRWNDVIDYYVAYKHNLDKIIIQHDDSYYGTVNTITFEPATKEQIDLLSQKMKEAGYEWDAEKKESKKIEQKPICKLDNSYTCVKFPFKAKVKSTGTIVTIYDGQLGPDGKKWIKYQSDQKDGYKVYEPNNLELICEVEQKSANYSVWIGGSEVNDNYLTKEEAEKLADKYRKDGYEDVAIEKIEQKPAWSEEDEKERKRVVGLLEGWLSTYKETCYAEDCKCGIDWLKSLKDRYTWKPSDEQMGVIEAVINNRSFQRRHLDSLYEQLKKLREE